MFSASERIRLLDLSIARAGEVITLQRLTTDPDTGVEFVDFEADVPAHIRSSRPEDLDGGGDVQDARVIVSASGLTDFGIPARDDRALIYGIANNIQQISPVYYAGQLVRVNMLCRGSGG